MKLMLIIMTDAVPAVFIVCVSLVCVFIVIELLLFHTHAHPQRTLVYIIMRMCVVFIGLFILYIMIVFVLVEQKYNIVTTSIVIVFIETPSSHIHHQNYQFTKCSCK